MGSRGTQVWDCSLGAGDRWQVYAANHRIRAFAKSERNERKMYATFSSFREYPASFRCSLE